MKKYIGLAMATTVISGAAFASIARLEALGEDQYGSWNVSDSRNMFLNAAEIHNHNDFATFEWGNSSQLLNDEKSPKSQGGIFKKSGDMIYGMYFGADSNTASRLRIATWKGLENLGAITATEFGDFAKAVQNENTLDLFVGGGSSLKWGAKISYAKANNEQGYDNSANSGMKFDEIKKEGIVVGLGAFQGDNAFYANIGAKNQMKLTNMTFTSAAATGALGGQDYEFKGKIGVQLGYVRSLTSDSKAYVEYQQQGVEEKSLDLAGSGFEKDDWDIQKIKLGWGKIEKINDVFTLFTKAEYYQEENKNQGFIEGSDNKTERITATLGFEAAVKEWLALRGSVSNNLIGTHEDEDDNKKTLDDSVDVKLGATLAFGDFGIDGLIGNDSNGDGAAGDDNGNIRTDSLMSRVAMTYKF